MKKLIICLMLAVFCLSMTPLLASDHNPYKSNDISDRPGSDDDGWDHPKYIKHDDSHNGSKESVKELKHDEEDFSLKDIFRLFTNILGGKDGQNNSR